MLCIRERREYKEKNKLFVDCTGNDLQSTPLEIIEFAVFGKPAGSLPVQVPIPVTN